VREDLLLEPAHLLFIRLEDELRHTPVLHATAQLGDALLGRADESDWHLQQHFGRHAEQRRHRLGSLAGRRTRLGDNPLKDRVADANSIGLAAEQHGLIAQELHFAAVRLVGEPPEFIEIGSNAGSAYTVGNIRKETFPMSRQQSNKRAGQFAPVAPSDPNEHCLL